MQPRGLFISFEGIDGAGKSSHIAALADAFRAQGRSVTQTREPGGTAMAEQLRALVLHEDMDALTEALLVFAGRRDHLRRVIEPAMARGEVVLCDRFTDATFAYQGRGRGFDEEVLRTLERWVQASPALAEDALRQPDMTLWFDLPPAVAAERLAATRAPDRFESEPAAFFGRVSEGYAARAAEHPQRFVRIDAERTRHQVWQQITQAMVRRGWLAIMVAAQGGPA
ncbi:dTMP kinase [Pseudorhodoferax sp. Leaf267]|uniref:dTMP kinase n=1 Tax=Pseudorhodoferax sp. Leaf267 TaxID=1736316 RepID=UPI0006F783B2|nr:dTMP kinase [Pseudorhodoferax sp. Leaf267]KQP14885.1 thymidylate kinase [Pseudorhodoferax sp. Leaf267]